MTIIAGFPSRQFVLLAADSQESYVGDRAYVTKVTRIGWPKVECLVGGAGGTEFIELAVQRLCEHKPPSTLVGLRGVIARIVRDIRIKHLSVLPDYQRDELAPLLLVAGWSQGEGVRLIRAEHTAVFERSPAAIGAGDDLARYLIATYYTALLPLDQVARFAVYLLHQVEKYKRGCGPPSRIMWLDDKGRYSELDQAAIAQHELSTTTVIDAGARWLLHGVDPVDWDFNPAGIDRSIENVAQVLKERFRLVYPNLPWPPLRPPRRGSAPSGPAAGGSSPSTPDSSDPPPSPGSGESPDSAS
jgi:hypothetical protein